MDSLTDVPTLFADFIVNGIQPDEGINTLQWTLLPLF